MRIFISLNISKNYLSEIERVQEMIQRDIDSVRCVQTHSMHMTLKFLDSLTDEELLKLKAPLQAIARYTSPIKASLNRLDIFPGINRARVLWAGVNDGAADIALLFRQIEERLGPLGFSNEDRVFTPHITLGRFKKRVSRKLLKNCLSHIGHIHIDLGVFSEIHIMESLFRADKVQYRVIESFTFEGKGRAKK